MVVEAAVALATQAGCYQGLEALGSLAYQRVLCVAHFHRCRSKMPSSTAEEHRVGSERAVGLS